MTTATLPSLDRLQRHIVVLVQHMCQSVAAYGPRNPALVPLIWLAWHRFRRAGKQLSSLMARLAAGRPARTRRPGPSRAGQPRPKAEKLPRDRGFMQRLMPDTHMSAGLLSQLVNDPEMVALLEVEPAFARILRPLCHMFGVDLPANTAKPAPRPAPKPAQRQKNPEPDPKPDATPASPPEFQPPWRRSD